MTLTGLVFATILTLVVTPSALMWQNNLKSWSRRRRERREAKRAAKAAAGAGALPEPAE